MQQPSAIPSLLHLPRLSAVLADVLGVKPWEAHLHLDLAEALACDDLDRDEVVSTLDGRLGIPISEDETAACESVADLLRLVAAKQHTPRRLDS
ncbi:acyl carrier protein [Roseomonas sp. AR75]|jgi:acyl carrier protein|uniref:acyl carrier protein n=1 Tax=Roseomonas sp. AR75 TaxID=2562311 RepID=UPI0010C14C88|nr:acyl carrier protein [Roseomonas sp. AR75]